MSWPALPQPDPTSLEDVHDRDDGILRGDLKSWAWDGGGDLSQGKDSSASAGFFLDSSAGAIQAYNLFAEGGTFTNITVLDSILQINSGTSFPASPADGELFYRTDQNRTYRYDDAGAQWIELDYIPDSNRIANGAITNAKIDTVSATKVTTGTLTAATITLRNTGANNEIILKAASGDTRIYSDNFSAGSAGWQIQANGNAEFNDVTVRGTLESSRFRTDSSGQRLEIRGDATESYMRLFDSGGTQVGRIGYNLGQVDLYTLGSSTPLVISSGEDLDVVASADLALYGANGASLDSGGDVDITALSTNADVSISVDRNINLIAGNSDGIRFQGNGFFAGRLIGQSLDVMRFQMGEGNDYWEYDKDAEQFDIAIDNNSELTLGGTGFIVPNVYNSTDASAANVYVDSSGRLWRSTSSEDYKTGIRPWKPDGSVLDLEPIVFYPMAGNPTKGEPLRRRGSRKLLSFGAQQAASVNPKFTQGDDALDWPAITAALQAEVVQLRHDVDRLLEAA